MVEGEVLMTRSFVARDLEVSECTVDNLAKSGRLPSMMTTAKRRVFRQSDVERYKAQLQQSRRIGGDGVTRPGCFGEKREPQK